jgi:hypothetical protein
MPSEREKELARLVAAMPTGDDVLVIDGRTGRAAAHRPGSAAGEAPASALVVLGPIDLDRLGVERISARPEKGEGPPRGSEPDHGDLDMLRPQDARKARSERNKFTHGKRAAAEVPRGATSAPVARSGLDPRPSASDQAPEAPTRPGTTVRAI